MVDQNQCSTSSSFESDANIEIGVRVECLSQYGTVKYIGEVAGHNGTWLGIDWDDVGRGKHNGAVDGHQYFQAR